MSPQTFIFIGQSGAGKGTQARLLVEYLKKVDQDNSAFYLESGQKFRELLARDTYTSKLAREIGNKGMLQPSFLAIHIWSHIFIEDFNGSEHIVIDGTPRSLIESEVFDGAMKFYGRNNVKVLYLSVTDEWARERLLGRGRKDDMTDDLIDQRFSWFRKDVIPTIDKLKKTDGYEFLEINGEQTIEEVHQEILNKLQLTANN